MSYVIVSPLRYNLPVLEYIPYQISPIFENQINIVERTDAFQARLVCNQC